MSTTKNTFQPGTRVRYTGERVMLDDFTRNGFRLAHFDGGLPEHRHPTGSEGVTTGLPWTDFKDWVMVRWPNTGGTTGVELQDLEVIGNE